MSVACDSIHEWVRRKARFDIAGYLRSCVAIAALVTVAGCNSIPPCPAGPAPDASVLAQPFQPAGETATFEAGTLPGSGQPYNHAASIIALPDGELLAAWVAGSAELARDTAILLARRPAGSARWNMPSVIADKADAPDANPVLFVAPDGTLWLFHVEMFGDTFCEGRVLARTSEDAGLSWTSDHPVFDATCVMIRNRPIVLRGGRWLMPAYVEAFYASQFWASDDGGNTWMSGQPMVTLPNNNLQPAVVELADGSLLSLMRADGPDRSTWEGRSHDCGRTWSLQPRPDLPNPDSGLDLLRLSTGELVVAYNPSADQRRPLAVAFSTDDGHTWSAPRLIAEGPPQLSYPSFAAGPDGTIHVVYSDRLTAIGHVAFNRAWLYEAAETTP